jgi:hypothetical protein
LDSGYLEVISPSEVCAAAERRCRQGFGSRRCAEQCIGGVDSVNIIFQKILNFQKIYLTKYSKK